MFKLTHTDKDRPLRWLWCAILSLLNWSRNSLEEHRQLSSSCVPQLCENLCRWKQGRSSHITNAVLSWTLILLQTDQVTVRANLYSIVVSFTFLTVTRLPDLLNVTTMTRTLDDSRPSDCCVTGRQMLKLHIWDWRTIQWNKMWPNLFTMCYLLQREDLLSGYVQIVAFYLTSPGPGEEVPQQGGL